MRAIECVPPLHIVCVLVCVYVHIAYLPVPYVLVQPSNPTDTCCTCITSDSSQTRLSKTAPRSPGCSDWETSPLSPSRCVCVCVCAGVEILFKSHLHMVQVTYWTYLHLAGPTCTLTVHARRYHITFTTLNASSIFMIHHNHV